MRESDGAKMCESGSRAEGQSKPRKRAAAQGAINMTVSARAILRLQSQADAGLASMRMLITTKAIRP